MIGIIYLILVILVLLILSLILLKVKIYVYIKIINIDNVYLKIIFSIKNIKLYTYKLYIRSGISKYINRDKNKKSKKKKDKPNNSITNKIIKHISKEKTNLKIGVGFNDVIITNYAIVLISTILSFLCSKYIRLKDRKNIKYNVMPIYNNACIIFESMLKIRLVIIILFFISKKIKSGGNKYGRTSN